MSKSLKKMGTLLKPYQIKELSQVSISAYETADSIEIQIDKLSTEKNLNLIYKPVDNERREFILQEKKDGVEFSRTYATANFDDVEWENEILYPCQECERHIDRLTKARQEREKLESEIKTLKEFIKKTI